MPPNEIAALIDSMRQDGSFDVLANSRAIQFGTPNRPYVGATLLPEREVSSNQFTEENVSYRTIVANDGSRYGPSQIKKGEILGEADVKLAEQDLAREFTGREYDAWRRLIRGRSMDAIVALSRWVDIALVRGMLDKQERQRWEAIVDAAVPLRGDNEYRDEMTYSDPAGHRIDAANAFDDDAVDPFDLFSERQAFFASKGYNISRIFLSTSRMTRLMNNAKIRARSGGAVINESGSIVGVSGLATRAVVNSLFSQMGLPTPEIYDATYRTQEAVVRYLPEDALVLIAGTDRDESVNLGDRVEIVSGTIGYHAIGTAVGQDAPGRVLNVESFKNKPPRIEGEIFQTSAPVILEPEAISVVRGV